MVSVYMDLYINYLIEITMWSIQNYFCKQLSWHRTL